MDLSQLLEDDLTDYVEDRTELFRRLSCKEEDGGLQRGQELVPLASLDVGSESRVDVRHSLPTH